MFSNPNSIRHGGVSRFGGPTALGLSLFSVVRISTLVFLIVIEHVSHIGGSIAQSQQQQQQHHSLHMLSDTHRLAKRMDLEACLGQFDVHNNTIIRTGESQAIGGKYLQGLELDTMEECQRLCCETDSCDVYIFEDKNGGYCYLFECGPPENFHCKFTRHANYTSAVLTPLKLMTTTRPPPPPPPNSAHHQQGTSNLSQQEWELTSLKVKPDKLAESAAAININGQQQKPATRIGQQTMDNGFPQKAVNTTAQLCSRFQFPCHSGECIAVYNACDGIPQCEDGSDEGPECSGATMTNNGAPSNSKGSVETANIHSIALDGATNQKYQTLQQTSQQQLQNLQQQQQQQQQSTQTINSPIVNNREDVGAWANRKMVAEAQQTDGVNSGDLNSHIFTHKNGLQLPHNMGAGNAVTNSNGNSNSNIGAIDMNVGIGNYPNSNTNLSPLYAANIQRSRVYMPQVVPPQQQNGAMYAAAPQQQMLDQQGHIYLPANVNWAQQQQQQQHQQKQLQQFPAVVTPLTAANERSPQLSQGPSYVISTSQQAVQHYPQKQLPQQQNIDQQTKVGFMPASNINEGKLHAPQLQTQQQVATGFQSTASAQNKVDADHENRKGSSKKALGKEDNEVVANSNDNEAYDDYGDQSTEAPKKKPHRHRKMKAKASATNTVGKELPNIMKADLTDDPVQQSIAQRKEQHYQSQPPSPVHEQYRMIHENLAMEFRDHDGQSDRPGGAVLSLTLGLLVTAALAILIGCRMRTVGRRARRMGSKFSHDADFLVNGMYL